MFKKIFVSLLLVIAILSCFYWFKTFYMKSGKPDAEVGQAAYKETVAVYDVNNLEEGCSLNSEMACAVDFAVKCTLNPQYNGCVSSKLPRFIFMEDQNLERPTEMSFKIVKIKPISADLVEIHTDSDCNGNWFGLCRGRVIYVLVPEGQTWRVKDIYAMEN